ncbi:MAG: ABC transporter permease, partial [bacterium]
MVKLEVSFLVLFMEFAWAVKNRLYLLYLALPIFFYFVAISIQSLKNIPTPIYFLPSSIALTFLLTALFVSYGFVQKGKSFWNLSKLTGSPTLYIYLGELFFSSLIAVLQSILIFILIRLFSGIGGFGNLLLFLIASFLFNLLYTSLFLLISLPSKFQPLTFLYYSLFLLLFSLFFSNLFFPIQSLPTYIRFFAYLNPLTYGIEGINEALGGKRLLPFSSTFVFPTYYL